MALFVVNRHTNENDEKIQSCENKHLEALQKRIERNKKLRLKQKERGREYRKLKVKIIKKRLEKKWKKEQLIPIPDNLNDLIDINIPEPVEQEEPLTKQVKLDPSSLEGFTVLGTDNFDKKTKVKRVLPKWLSNPTVISVNLQNLETKVSGLKELDKKLRNKLKENGIKYFFPVQAQLIPWLLQSNKHANIIFPRDVCVSAPTGSGKTLAFVLPIIQALQHFTVKKIRALIILPTQDLAAQVFKTFRKFTQNTHLDVSLITGFTPFTNEQKQLIIENEAFGYISKTDILVCTAGRLVDHIKSTKGFSLKNLQFLVIDEADRVLDTVQNDWLYHLEKHISHDDSSTQVSKVLNLFTLKKPRPPQKLLFSATLSQDPEKLQKLSLFQPKLFTSIMEVEHPTENLEIEQNTETFIGKYTTPKELTEKYIVCSMDLKPLVLYEFIKTEKLTKTMVFTFSLESAHRLTILLKSLFGSNMKIEEISSNLEAKHRNNLIDKFSKGDVDILVCTDSLARGIDLPGVQCVISYSAPKYLKTYIHRAGRTARAGELGLAVTVLHNKSQLSKFQILLQQADKKLEEIKISEEELEPLGEQYKQALDDLKKTIEEEEEKDLLKIKSVKRTLSRKRKRKNSVNSDQ